MFGQDSIELAGWVVSRVGIALLLWHAFREWTSACLGRSRRGPKCPGGWSWWLFAPFRVRCGYDMRGMKGGERGLARCPECGRQSTPRQLGSRPIRWGLVWLCVPLLLLSYATRTLPRVRAEGWTGWVPTWVLVAVLPWAEEDPSVFSQSTNTWTVPNPTVEGLLRTSLDSRLARGEVRGLEWRVLFHMATVGDPLRGPFDSGWDQRYSWMLQDDARLTEEEEGIRDDLTRLRFVTRALWPEESSVYARVDIDRVDINADMIAEFRVPASGHRSRLSFLSLSTLLNGYPRFDPGLPVWTEGDDTIYLGAAELLRSDATFTATIEREGWVASTSSRRVREYSADLPIEIAGDVWSALKPVQGEAMMARWKRADPPVLRPRTGATLPPDWALDLSSLDIELSVLDLGCATLGLTAEILADGQVIAVTQAWWGPPNGANDSNWVMASDYWESFVHLHQRNSFDPWLHVSFLSPSGTENIGVHELTFPPANAVWTVRLRGDPLVALRDFEATHAWSGSVELPLRIEGRDWTPPPPDNWVTRAVARERLRRQQQTPSP